MLILGHRGYSMKYPENTILAFKKAVEYGDGVELDVYLTSDSRVIVHHDPDFRRTLGIDKKVKELRSEELDNFRFRGEKIPYLEEVYDSLPKDTIINVEIKDFESVEKALKIVEEHNSLERTIFSSFNINSLILLRKLSRKARIGILIGKLQRVITLPLWVIILKAEYINLPIDGRKMYGKFFDLLIRIYKLFGVKIILWTVDDASLVKGIEKYVDIIITNNMGSLRKDLINQCNIPSCSPTTYLQE